VANRRIDQWKNRSIFVLDPTQTSEIQLSQGQEKFRLTRQDTLWLLSAHPYQESSQADGEAVREYLETLVNIKADELRRPREVFGVDFGKPKLEIRLTFSDGHEETVVAVPQAGEDSRYYVKTDRDRNIFVLFEFNFKRLAKTFEDFEPKEEE
jgi:hypothetical protein